jgi:hypothetical protein
MAFDVLYMGLTSGSTAMIDENRASGNLIQRPSAIGLSTWSEQMLLAGLRGPPAQLGGGVMIEGTILSVESIVNDCYCSK